MQGEVAFYYDNVRRVDGEGLVLALMLLEGVYGDVGPLAAQKCHSHFSSLDILGSHTLA